MRHVSGYRARMRVCDEPVYAVVDHAFPWLNVRGRIAVQGRRVLDAERRKATDVSRFMQDARRMHCVVEIAHEEARLAGSVETLQRTDYAARFFDARRLAGCALLRMVLAREVRC